VFFLKPVCKLLKERVLLRQLLVCLVDLQSFLDFLLHIENILFQICNLLLLCLVDLLSFHELLLKPFRDTIDLLFVCLSIFFHLA
jgi:hypothetical protein